MHGKRTGKARFGFGRPTGGLKCVGTGGTYCGAVTKRPTYRAGLPYCRRCAKAVPA